MRMSHLPAIEAWTSIPDKLLKAIKDLGTSDLDVRRSPSSWSIREIVHQLVEASIVASNVVITALRNPGGTYDASSEPPEPTRLERMGYAVLPVDQAIHALLAINRHVALLVERMSDGLKRTVKVRVAPDEQCNMSVEDVLQSEALNADAYAAQIRATRQHHDI